MTLSVSIIIPAYNAEKTLAKCLASVYASISCDDEVILVNDDSSDRTVHIAGTFNCSVLHLPHNSGAAHARNFGAKNAIKDIILFVDSDVLISKENVDNVKKYFLENKNVHSLTLNVHTEKISNSFFSDYKNLYMNSIISESENSVNYIYGSCCATRKIGFISWPEKMLLTEDSLWGYQQKSLGLEIHCLRDVQVTHLKEYTFNSLVRNDFLISSYFARSFLEFSRWNTLYSKESFGHTSKAQKISVVLAAMSIASLVTGLFIPFTLIITWLAINNKFFKNLYNQRGMSFTLKSVVWYFFTNLIYLSGIFYGCLLYRSIKPSVVESEAA